MRDLASIQKDFLNGVLKENKNKSLSVYRDLVVTNHLSALKDVYPVCLRIVGEKYFSYLSEIYLEKRPTNEPDLNVYGHDFSDFLLNEITEREELSELGYLSEVTEFEWNIYSASRKDFVPNSPEEIISKIVSNENVDVIFILNPSLSLSVFNYPIIEIWKEHQNEEVGKIELINSKNYVVVWKHNKDVVYQNIDENEFNFLNLLSQKKSFNELSEIYSDKEKELENFIATSINNGWIVDIEIIV